MQRYYLILRDLLQCSTSLFTHGVIVRQLVEGVGQACVVHVRLSQHAVAKQGLAACSGSRRRASAKRSSDGALAPVNRQSQRVATLAVAG
jgi:hypothetical protein